MAALGGSQGQAIVLDNPRDPLAIYQAGQQRDAQNTFRNQQLGVAQKKQRDAAIGDVVNFKYDDPGDRFKSWGQDDVNNTNQAVMSLLQKNPDADINQLRPQIMALQGAAQKNLNKAKEVSNLYTEKTKSIGSLKNIDQAQATGIMNQAINKKSPYEVDTDLLQNIEQVPAIYDLNGLVADSVSSVKDQYKNTDVGALQNSPLGQFIEVTDHKMRFKDLDKTVDYILRGNDITDDGINQKINGGVISDRIRYNIAQQEVAAQGGNPNDVTEVMPRFKEIQYKAEYAPKVRESLKGILGQLQQEDRDVTVTKMGQFKQESQKDKDYANAKIRRAEALDAIITPFGKNGQLPDANPKAVESLGKLRGGDFAGGKVIDAKFERGGYTISPEWMKKISTITNTKEGYETLNEALKHLVPVKGNANKVMLTTKTGTIFGAPETQINIPLDLSDPNAKVVLNAMMNQNPGERKVYYDDMNPAQPASNQYLDDDDEDGLNLDD